MQNRVRTRLSASTLARTLSGVAPAALVLLMAAPVPAPVRAQEAPAAPSLSGLAVPAGEEQGRMLVESDTLIYDIDDETIAAVGNVVIYYGDYTLVADRVDVESRTERVRASGGVELTDAAGTVVRAEALDLTDDLREGVIDALQIVTAQNTAFNADRARRTEGDVTELENGIYLPCVDCDGVPGRKPVWQIKAKRIIHRQGERTITFRQTTFEFLGVPIAYVPAFTAPDPTVRRKSGFLAPRPSYDGDRGVGVVAPYFYALAPNMDVTFSPGFYSNQGVLLDAEFRHRVVNGAYSIRVAGLRQGDPTAFEETSGNRLYRGSFSSTGKFTINDRWTWGWDLAVATDRSFFDDYDRPEADDDVAVNDVFLEGVDGRNRFEAHAYGFFVQQEDSNEAGAPEQDVSLQAKQPVVHPVIDHEIYADEPVAGGEFSVRSNVTSLTRAKDDIFEFETGPDTRLRGAAGTFTRASVDALWRRRLVDGLGQVFTPFAYVRGDVFFTAPEDGSALGLGDGDVAVRAMPAVGLEYSYPILFQSAIGSTVIEPTAQLIVRPNETETGDIPNEDAQSLVFDATSLFDYDKFSGYDRAEGGTRLNVGFRYSTQFNNGFSLTGTVGQSIHLAGTNSFQTDTAYDTGADSGLESDASDYVASLNINTSRGLLFGASTRFDEETFDPNRVTAQVVGLAGPLTTAVTYAFLREQPELGIDEDRSELQAAASLRLDTHWRLFGATRFDIGNDNFVRHAFGVGYDDEAFSFSLAYSEDKTRTTGEATDRTIYLRLGFRTLGDINGSFDVMQ
ncbi:LPS-assembly protein LptD [Mongoliimonas terrestris]|uniref:LPS-assembly protein LptD n=1 Tax=Mongoliimonas terrestris TaxID=1709001 RepID=UPI000AB83908|nr:LPS-assembly protein LptD [Mongoliimonas terrestris]